MTAAVNEPSTIIMRFRLNSKCLNRSLTLILLVLVLAATLMVTQLFLFYDSLQLKAVHAHVTTQRFSRNKTSSHAKSDYDVVSDLSSQSFPDASRYSDSKFEQLKTYHHNTTRFRQEFDCRKLFEGDRQEQRRVIEFHAKNSHTYPVVANENVPEITADCQAFKAIRGYRTDQGSEVERKFPLAYVILVHRDFEHLERLLRTIYMPQHSICIHVDNKVPESLKQAVSSLARCFHNVILASRPQDIVYAHMSRLLADIVCMKDLVQKDKSWRYLINYAATEFPLRTNLETVKILQTLHGLNDIHEQFQRRLEERFKTEYHVVGGRMKQTKIALPPPPYNMTIIKGQAYNTFSRAFLEWVFTDEKPRRLLQWCNKTYSPDEHYWASLNDLYHNPFLQTPGGFQGHPDKKGYITRFISWQYSKPKFKCQGKTVHNICIFSALDLPGVLPEMHLAANKFDVTLDPIAYSCMEELLENKTRAHLPFNIQDYSRLYFINYKPDSKS